MGTTDAGWYGEDSAVSQTRGRLFEALCLVATSIGLLSVFVLLLYVANDAFKPLSADPGWHLVFLGTVGLPAVVLGAYYYFRADGPAGEVAYTTTGLPIVGLLLAGGLGVVFAELLAIREFFALAIGVAVLVGGLVTHARLRSTAALERLLLAPLLAVVALFGTPPTQIARLLGLSRRVVSLPELILKSPLLPLPSLQLLSTLTLPVAALAGWFVGRRRESRRDGLVAAGLVLAGGLGTLVLEPLTGIAATTWAIVYTTTAVPIAVYVEGIYRRRDGIAGLAFPIVLVVGGLLGVVLTDALGFAGPETWLDWAYLTSVPDTDPAAAGIYPALVGSVMLLIVVVVATFPIGVGAAIYLEEYAPSSGLMGKIVTVIEINISNLAGVPSVVYGLLGLAVFVRYMHFPNGSIVVGGLTVGLLILPIVIISAQEAIEAVPDSQRQAAYGMGSTRWQTVRNVVLPEAIPGILTGTILALGRAIGETAPLLLVGIAASVRLAPNSLFDLGSAMPRQIYTWAFEPAAEFRYGVVAAGVVTLLVVLLVLNGTAIILRNKFERA
ncbi:Phosphate ABC transporter permease protein [Halorhabdus tiamatea SARL4B]|uniref:Phosphate transport system permease protein PstA n=1 Tax=Halorhabdus tiamatea SARL4B TaxID=1033806 RepID=F7PKI4_9EURY|nr:phosphate ABC transporter permease PstA [Halorhabdus tiamatea]ERJ05501.1 Phosphate ABC transporter permease protein [Halorhabdus tiamatea SARL4B]CCQ32908.1 phosphate transport system permease protein PstA (TC 3.A.1.7.1) [Halorhabdus tiamatea SARL4B]